MTVLEVGWLRTAPGAGDGWTEGALAIVLSDDACSSAAMYRSIEEPGTFVLLAVWDSVDAHEAFRAGPGRSAFREHVRGVVVGPSDFAHYELVAGGGFTDAA